MNCTSLKFGTRRITHGSEVSNVAAIIGSTAFFAPLIVTSPRKGTPPFINKLSIEIFREPAAFQDEPGPGERLKFSVSDCSQRSPPRQSTFLARIFFAPIPPARRRIPTEFFHSPPEIRPLLPQVICKNPAPPVRQPKLPSDQTP